MTGPFEGRKLELSYPVRWTYTVIGDDEYRMRVAVGDVCGSLEHSTELSNRSRTGRYCSLRVEVVVRDDDERTGLFHALLRREEIRYVV